MIKPSYSSRQILTIYVLNKRSNKVPRNMKQIIIVHGGAGDINDAGVPGKLHGVKEAIRAGNKVFENNGSALDAVEAAVRSMELDEHFNAGYGSCLNTDGNVECEASIMNGQTLKAGCVTLIKDIMHPISVARRIMEKTNHNFIGGVSAMEFAKKENFEILKEGSLVTEAAKEALAKFLERQKKGLDTTFSPTELDKKIVHKDPSEPGTVGAVAMDRNGNIAVATSTGGITGKIPGRIGDTPLLGCGTYADNTIGGVSTTGHGETIMRFNLAQKILERMRYKSDCDVNEATKYSVTEMTNRLVGTGGAITIDKNGLIGIHWTSKRMSWAYIKDDTIHYGIDHGLEYTEKL